MFCFEEHKDDPSNVDLLNSYKKENIYNIKTPMPEFPKQIKLSFVSRSDSWIKNLESSSDSEVVDSSIYILQTVSIEDQQLNIFLVCKKRSYNQIE